jgi:DNA-binding transcriptional LysR family regulator
MKHIKKPELRRQDLGLLVVLDALLAEGSVTGAAARLHLSQPAASSELQRLREWIGDPLLVRVKGGYTLTERAVALAVPVRSILAEIEQTVRSPAPFEPASAKRRFRLATNDAFQLAVLPDIVARLRREAPGITLDVVPAGPEADVAALQSGAIDLCAGYFSTVPQGLHSSVLLSERLVGLARRDHPIITGERPSLRQYARAAHVAIAPQGHAFIAFAEAALADAGLSPDIALTVPNVQAAPFVVARSDLVATVPERVALAYAEPLGLRIFRTPVVFPGFDIQVVWHERAHREPALAWLRGLLSESCAGLAQARRPRAARLRGATAS